MPPQPKRRRSHTLTPTQSYEPASSYGSAPMRTKKSRVPRNISRYGDVQHCFTRVFELEQNLLLSFATQTYGASVTFDMTNIPGFNEFQSLFDWYRFDKIEFHITPNGNTNDLVVGTGTGSRVPVIHSIITTDPVAVPTSAIPMYEYTSYKATRAMKEHVRSITPRIVNPINPTTTIAYLEPRKSQFISFGEQGETVPHYGVTYFIDCTNLQAGQNSSFRVWGRAFFTCKVQK